MSIAGTFKATLDIAGEALDVLTYTLKESLGELDSVGCSVVKFDQLVPDPKTLVGKPATFKVVRESDDSERLFKGEVLSAALRIDHDGMNALDLVIASRLWRLTARTDNRVFRQKSAVEIIQEVMEGAGIKKDEMVWQVEQSYPKRDYTAQYRESDWEFVSRLLAEEGIFFFTEVRDGLGKFVFIDNGNGVGDANPKTLPFEEEFGTQFAQDCVRQLSEKICVRSDKVMLRDYDFKHPKLKLDSSKEGTDPGSHANEIYVYAARFSETSRGDHLAQVLLEANQADRHVVEGETGVVGLRPGYRFSIEEHPYAAFNQEYLIIATELSGASPSPFATKQFDSKASARFLAVPTKKTKFRLRRDEVARKVAGLQVALTTGPSGQEISANEHGQVTVKFPWDRKSPLDNTASCWMRTSQLPTGGSMLLPRVGWEVAVACVEGDVDQPLVMSRLYNARTPPPYKLPENAAQSAIQTATTPGGGSANEIRMTDTKGKEEMFFNASRDMGVNVGNNTTHSIGNDNKCKIGSNQKIDVTDSVTNSVGSNHTLTVTGNQTMTVKSLMVDDVTGSHTLSITGNRTHSIAGDHRRTVNGSSTHTVNGNEITLVAGSLSDNTLNSFTHTVSGALAYMTTSDRSLLIGAAHSETTGGLKIIAAKGGRAVQAQLLSSSVGGALITSVKGSRVDKAALYSETAAGAQIVKAKEVLFEATEQLSLVMGASTITLTPASVAIAGANVKVDGNIVDPGMVMDN